METPKENPQNNSLPSSQKKSELANSLPIYLGRLTQKGIVDNTIALKVAFPALTTTFFDALINGFIETGFTDAEMKKAIDHVKYTCKYPSPQLAEFINYDGLYSERIKEPRPPTPEEIEDSRKRREEADRISKEKDDAFFKHLDDIEEAERKQKEWDEYFNTH